MKKISSIFAAFMLLCLCTNSQNLAINADGSPPDANAILDVKSNSKGILIPRMNTVARMAIPPTKGLLVYDSTTQSFWYNTGTQWQSLAITVPQPTDAWLLGGNLGTNVETHFVGTIDNVPLSFRVNNRPAGRIDPITKNLAYGFFSANSYTTGHENTAIGDAALRYNTEGNFNTALGYESLMSNTTGFNNTGSSRIVAKYYGTVQYCYRVLGLVCQ
jgi:trimeric autotransporter adhesin